MLFSVMTNAISLKNTKILGLLLSAIIFSIIYLIFVAHTFAQGSSPSATRAAKRDANKIKVCQVQERNIKNRLDSLIKLVTNQENKFTEIATRVENHYTTKLVPQGKILSNYNALVADIAAKKSAVDSVLNTAKTDVAGFSCTTSTDPKTDLQKFRKDMQAVKSALKDYRTSIRNLIVALGTLSSPKPSESPEANKK